MNTPPIPPPSPYFCSHCGAELQGQVALCPQCGARIQRNALPAGTVMSIIGLTVLALPLGLSGSCFLLLGFTGWAGDTWILVAIGAALSGFALLCVRSIRNLMRKK
jgi:hypothetical protein